MTKHSFLKCGLSSNLNGTEDDQTKRRGIEVYTMLSAKREFPLFMMTWEWKWDRFHEVDTDYSNDLTESDPELESD